MLFHLTSSSNRCHAPPFKAYLSKTPLVSCLLCVHNSRSTKLRNHHVETLVELYFARIITSLCFLIIAGVYSEEKVQRTMDAMKGRRDNLIKVLCCVSNRGANNLSCIMYHFAHGSSKRGMVSAK